MAASLCLKVRFDLFHVLASVLSCIAFNLLVSAKALLANQVVCASAVKDNKNMLQRSTESLVLAEDNKRLKDENKIINDLRLAQERKIRLLKRKAEDQENSIQKLQKIAEDNDRTLENLRDTMEKDMSKISSLERQVRQLKLDVSETGALIEK